MHFIFSKEASGAEVSDLIVYGAFEGRDLDRVLKLPLISLGGHLKEHAKDEGFSAKEGSCLIIHAHGKAPSRKICLLGLGSEKDFSLERLRRAAGTAVKIAGTAKTTRLAASLPFGLVRTKTGVAIQAMLEGFMLADYGFERYKTPDKDAKRLETITVHVRPIYGDAMLKQATERAMAMADATTFVRDLVNTPSLDMTPAHLVEEAGKIAGASSGKIRLQIHDKKKLAEMGCGGILAVAQGSEQEPFMIHLSYKPKKARRRVVLVGKGVTFDSGGLSLKPADSMMDMKIDMAGAAAILGVFKALPKLLPNVEIHGIAGLVENMPSGRAIRPGDIVKTMSGKTIEILNTDAEGRVTLADTLHYGSKLKPDAMIDLATLTGACMVALGQDFAGLMSNDATLTARVKAAAETSGEQVWELPLPASYAEQVKSKHADLKNITGTRYGGAITAGLFLKEFVGQTPWAHLDIAGPAYAERDGAGYHAWGASGFGARLLLEYLLSM
jgi:leucyl aminopeptidase